MKLHRLAGVLSEVTAPDETPTGGPDCNGRRLGFRSCRGWWHHSAMISRHPRVVFAAGILSAAVLVACSTPGNYRKDAAHEQLLQTLWECLVEVHIRGERHAEFVSPCIDKDVSSLNGIPRSQLIKALGPAQFCTNQTEESFPEKADCSMNLNPQWSFYRHADPIVSGGGPELVCVAANHDYCVTVEWRRSQ